MDWALMITVIWAPMAQQGMPIPDQHPPCLHPSHLASEDQMVADTHP